MRKAPILPQLSGKNYQGDEGSESYREYSHTAGRKWSETNDTKITIIYVTGGWPQNFTDVTIVALREEQGATKCGDHNMHNQPHKPKVVVTVLSRRTFFF
jgi:hypothetical protein